MLPIDLQNKIMLYNIHPIAEILRWYLNKITRRTSNQSYHPSMFKRYKEEDEDYILEDRLF